MEECQRSIGSSKSDKVTWLANQIFKAFPREVSGLKFYSLGCGCTYYQRISRDGNLDPQIGIYRDAEKGACEICMGQDEGWRDRVIDEVVIYNRQFEIDFDH